MSVRLDRSELAWLLLVLAGLLAIYLPSLGNAPVYDDAFLADGGLFSQYGSLAHLQPRMLSYGSFVWVRELLGDGWWKQRLVNLVIHMGVVVSLWALWREVLRHVQPRADEEGAERDYARSPALAFAILFYGLNPVAVYGVAYLIQRSIEMATLFTVLALWSFARAIAERKAAWLAGAVVFYVLAVMSKEYAILAPLAAIPLYIHIVRPSGRRLAVMGLAGAALVALAASLLWLRYGEILGKPFDEYSRVYLAQLSAMRNGTTQEAWPLSVVNEAWLFFQYGLRWFLPFPGLMSINLRPPFPVSIVGFPQVLGALGYLAILGGGFFLLVRYRDWRALPGLGMLFAALLYPTEFATVWVQDPFVLYRSYLWAIGMPGIVFCLLHGAPWRIAIGVGISVAALFVAGGLDRVLSLENAETAWSDAIEKLPDDPRAVGRWFAYLNRGSEYADRNDFNAALRDFEMSSRLGDMGMGAFDQGSVLAAQGRHADALAAFDRAEAQGYDLWNLPLQRGLSLRAVGRVGDALSQLEQARKRDPPSPSRQVVLLELGRTALAANRPQEALDALSELNRLDPGNKQGRYLFAMALVSTGDFTKARPILDDLVREDGTAPAYYGRALANNGLHRKAEALADIDAAIQRDPNNAGLRQWRERITATP